MILEELWNRKVPQYVGSYLAIGFGLLQFLLFITQRYPVSEKLVDKYLLVWLLLVPAFTMLIYFRKGQEFSTKGASKWSNVFVISNTVLALLAGIFMFNGDSKTSESEVVEITNEEGSQVTAIVPSLNKIKTIANFQFENLTGDKEQDWLGVAFSHLLQLDLNQRPEFYTISAYSLNSLYNTFGIPSFSIPNIGLKRKIAQRSRNEYFTNITYEIKDDQFVIKGELYDSGSGKSIMDLHAIDSDPYAVVEELKTQIVNNIPNALEELENQVDLPVSSLITNNKEALEYFVKSRIVFSDNPNALDETVELAKKAIELDPTCAICHFYVADPLYGLGKKDESLIYLRNAVRYGSSLPERMQFLAKETLYSVTDRIDDYTNLQEVKRKMFPYEFSAYANLLHSYKANYGIDSAKVLIEESIENGNLEKGLLTLYELQLENEEYDNAHETLDRFYEEFPNREQDKFKYASIYEQKGEIDKSIELLLEQLTLDPLDSNIKARLANLYFRNLEFSKANQIVNQGMAQASSTMDSLNLMWKKGHMQMMCGQIEKALKTYSEFDDVATKKYPINRALSMTLITKVELNLSRGEAEKNDELINFFSKYDPEGVTLKLCNVALVALARGYKPQMDVAGFQNCRTNLETFGDGYTEYIDVLLAYKAEEYERCIQILEKDNQRVMKFIDMQYFAAKIYRKSGNRKMAKEILQKEIDKKTFDPIYYYEMALLLETEDKQKSKEYLDKTLAFLSDADDNYIPFLWAKDLEARLMLQG